MNTLYPIFLKANQLNLLIVGGGSVGAEKLRNVLRSSPGATVSVIALEINREIEKLAASHPQVQVVPRKFQPNDLVDTDLLIAATDDRTTNRYLYDQAKRQGVIVNVADTPELCDFYMCSVVTKGDLKIGISTNGRSPTFAKRFRQWLEDLLPDELPQLLNALYLYRNQLKTDFQQKVKILNELTADLANTSTISKTKNSS